MLDGKKVLALIPARGGSKGLPGKNKKLLCGKPLIVWSIDAAKASKYVDDIIISSDDCEVFKIAEECGVRVPFKRPSEVASDTATAMDVILHAAEWLKAHKEQFDIIVYLQPTSPLRTSEDIDKGLEFFVKKNSNSVVGVCKSAKSKHLMNTLPADGNMASFILSENANKNRQEQEAFFQVNGALYISRVDYICSEKNWYGDKTFAYVMPESHSVDIDTELDFFIAKLFIQKKISN